jgi:cytochrome b pre-mRNA-processing protein 3
MFDAVRDFLSIRQSPERMKARALHEAVILAARRPVLYTHAGVPDTVDGRLDCIALHAFMLFRRMTGVAGWDEIGSELSSEIVADFDRSLREMGIGDMSIGKKVKRTSQVFFHRFDAYWGAVTEAEGAEPLSALLPRTVFQGNPVSEEDVAAMIRYMEAQHAHLGALDATAILDGALSFADPTPFFPEVRGLE